MTIIFQYILQDKKLMFPKACTRRAILHIIGEFKFDKSLTLLVDT